MDRSQRQKKINRTILLSLLSSMAVIFFVVESAIPNPVPWLRLGLANIVVMVAIVFYGVKDGLLVSFLRAMAGSMIVGTFLGPSFWLSISGGLASALIMGLLYRFCSPFFSLIGISIVGAYTHSLTQMVLVFVFLIQRREIFYLLPVILFSALATGFINGLAATFLVEQLHRVLSRSMHAAILKGQGMHEGQGL
ncbi:MAG: Gx transporter family protein [bacterium]